MQVSETMLAYERIVKVLTAADKDLARQFVAMGIPYKILQGDPYFVKHYSKWVRNAVDNYPVILGQSRKRKVCISAIPLSDKPAIVVGSGYSLNTALPYLKDWRGDIFCGNSNAYTLLQHGIVPTYVCVYDSHPLVADLMTRYKRWPESVRLLTHTLINPVLVQKWRGLASYYLVRRERMELFDVVLPAIFERCGLERALTWRICVVNNEVQLAAVLGQGMRPVFLVGCDFGWRDRSQWRCETYEPLEDGSALKRKDTGLIDRANPELAVDENGWEYTGDMIVLRDELHRVWWGNTVPIIDCSNGSLTAFPTADIADVVRLQGQGWGWVAEKRQEIGKKVADYLNRRVALKQEQWEQMRRVRDENVRRTDSDGTIDGVSGMVGGEAGGAPGEGGPGA